MALKWFETADIVAQEASTTRRKAETLFTQMRQSQEQRREAEEADYRLRQKQSMKQNMEYIDSRNRARAADAIDETNKTLHKFGMNLIGMSEANISAEICSGFSWAESVGYQAEQSQQQAIQEAEQKLRSDVVGKLLKDGVVTVGSPANVAEPLIQAAIAQRKAEDALKAGDYEAAAQWQAELQGAAPQAQIPEEGLELAEGIKVMPDYSVYSDDYVESIGRINPETLKFEQAQPGAWDKFKGVLSQLWKGLPFQHYYWMSPEEKQMADYKGQLIKWAGNLKGVENPEEFVENLLEPSSEVIMRALADEDEGVEPPPLPSSSLYGPQIAPDYTPTIGEQFTMDWVAPMLIFHMLKIPGPKQIREALKVPAWAGEKAVPRVAAQTVRGVLRPAEAIQTGIPRAIGGVVNRIPPLKRQFIEKPLENSIRNYLRQQGVTNPTQTQVNLYKQMIGQIPAVQTSAKLEQATMRALAQKFGNKAVGRYYTQGKRMSEEVIKDVIAHAKKTGNTDLQKGAEAFLQQWRASTTAEAQAELMRGDLFIKWMGELETGGVGITDDVLSGLGRMAATEVEGYYPALYHASMALEGEQAAHTLFVNNLGELFNIPVPDITASIVAKIFGKGALPVTASLIAQLANLGIPKATAEAMNSDEAWATLLRETLPELKQGAETGIEGIAEVTPAVAEEVSPTEADYMPAPVQQEFLARAETWLQQVPDVQPNTLHTVGVAGGEAFVRTDAAGNVEVAGISLMREETGKLTLSEVVAARPGGLAEREAGRDILNYIKENNIALPPREEMSRAAKGLLDKLVARGEIPEYAPSPVTPAVEPTAEIGWEGRTAPIEGVEVTVEGLEPIKNIRAIQSRYIAKRENVDAIKTELVKYTKANLPKEVQGKMLASVKNVKTEAQLRKAINKANEYAEVAVQKSLTPQIKNELTKIAPRKIVTGAKYGKFTPEAQRILDGIKKNINRERTDVQEEILKYMEAAEKGTMDYAEAAEQIEILSHSGLKGMSSDEMASTLSYIKTLKQTGRGIRAVERERDAAILTETTDAAGVVLTGGKGIILGAETVGTQGFEKKTGKWERVENVNLGLDDVLDKLSKFDTTSQPFQSALSEIGDSLHLSRSWQITGEAKWVDKAITKLGELFDAKGRNELNSVLNELSTEQVELGTFQNTDGVEVTLSLTRDQLAERWMQLQDPTLERTFREGMKWTDEMMAAVQDKIPEADMKMAQWLMENYQVYGNELQPFYQGKFHMDLPRNPYFSPLSRDVESDVHEHLAFARQSFAYSSVTSKHLIPRVKSIAPLKNNGALNTYVKFIGEMEHFKAFSSSMKLARQVFGNKDVKTAIRQYHGENILKHLNNHLDDIARDGIDKRKIVSSLDTIRRNFTIAVLARPSVSAKQFLSLPAYMMHNKMPIADFFSGVADFWKNPIQNYKTMKEKSSYLNERWTRGHERDIRLVKAKGWQQRLSNKKNWRDHFMVGIQFFDTLATAQGSYAVYKSMTKQKLGEQRAVLEAELATQRTQPSFGIEDMAALRKGGSFWALATMFMSQPNKYFRVISNNARNFQYGRGDPKRALFHVIMAWAVLPMIFQWASDAFQWKEKRQLRAGLLGPLNLMFIVRDISQGLWGWASQDQEFQYQGSPIFSTINEMQFALGGTAGLIKQGRDPLKEIDSEYLIRTVEHYAQVAGKLGGLPTPYLVQIERAIRDADLRQLIFTEYSLRGTPEQEAEKKALRKIQDAYAVAYGKTKWTELTKTEQAQFWQLRPDLE